MSADFYKALDRLKEGLAHHAKEENLNLKARKRASNK